MSVSWFMWTKSTVGSGLRLGLMWRVRVRWRHVSDDWAIRADVAPRWRWRGSDVATPRRQGGGGARGPRVAGARRHGDGRRAHQTEGEGTAKVVLTSAALGLAWFTGGEEISGGEVELDGGEELRWSVDEASARTGCAVTRRCRRCRRRGRSGGDGSARGGGGARWPAVENLRLRSARRGRGGGGWGALMRLRRGSPCSLL